MPFLYYFEQKIRSLGEKAVDFKLNDECVPN